MSFAKKIKFFQKSAAKSAETEKSDEIESEQLFFIAVVPEEVVCEELTGFKKEAADKFNSSRALSSPPHITLQSPFSWGQKNLILVREKLKELAKNALPFEITLHNFGCFKPRVIFVDVVHSIPLHQLKRKLNDHLVDELGFSENSRPFHPHLTVAYKDLSLQQFDPAWDHFSCKPYHRTFYVDAFYLLRFENEKWEIAETFRFAQ